MSRPLSRPAATLVGFSTILLWSTLAALTVASGRVPALELMALSFGIGGLAGVALWPFRPGAARAALFQPPKVWALGIFGIFGYHACYFFALRLAPPVEAGLINYLWPLLILVFSALLPGERLKPQHIVGCALALCGAVLVVTGGHGFSFNPAYALGYLAALAAAVIWGAYSVLSRRVAHVSTDAVTGFCLATALLAAILHFATEPTIWPENLAQWAAIVALGLGPVGLAFYLWDIGVKQGDIQLLGTASYAAPLLSTLVLILSGIATYSHLLLLACLLITIGAAIAALDLFRRRRPSGA